MDFKTWSKRQQLEDVANACGPHCWRLLFLLVHNQIQILLDGRTSPYSLLIDAPKISEKDSCSYCFANNSTFIVVRI